MGKYNVTSGQNIYDVALHLYGSIEGIVDLLMNNTSLSLNDQLNIGQELLYTDDFVINADIVTYYRMHNITPSNGERNVYFKEINEPRIIEIAVKKGATLVNLSISGEGEIYIDWGDNTPIELYSLPDKLTIKNHLFDNTVPTTRKIRIYGENYNFKQMSLDKLPIENLYFIKPVQIEKFKISDVKIDLSFISLLHDVYEIKLPEVKTKSLLPLLPCKNLMELDLTDIIIDQNTLDEYLISLVNNYNGRRCCKVILTTYPSGRYQKPEKDGNQKYIIRTGMEAIWVIRHEPAWNQGGMWQFILFGMMI